MPVTYDGGWGVGGGGGVCVSMCVEVVWRQVEREEGKRRGS